MWRFAHKILGIFGCNRVMGKLGFFFQINTGYFKQYNREIKST